MSKQRGFTLIELLTLVGVIAMAALVITVFVIVYKALVA